MRISSIAAIALLLSGCGAGALAAIREQATQDMSCAEQELKVEPAIAASGDAPTQSGVYYAEGCAQLRRYSVGCNIFDYCPNPMSVNVNDLIQRQAGFDLKCEAASVKVQRLNADTFGATGCERQASYVLLCHGGDCRVIQNSQSQ